MRKDRRSVLIVALATLVHAGLALPSRATEQPLSLAPSDMPRVGMVDERFNSYNVEMAEVIGGTFWKPYKEQEKAAWNHQSVVTGSSTGTGLMPGQDPAIFEARPPIDLTNARLRKLTAALGPAYMRVSGTWANTVYFHDSDTPAPSPPNGFQGVLTRLQWRGVIDFARAVNAKLTTSFAISTGVRDGAGLWTPDQARKLVAYTQSHRRRHRGRGVLQRTDHARLWRCPFWLQRDGLCTRLRGVSAVRKGCGSGDTHCRARLSRRRRIIARYATRQCLGA